ncbi:MAG: response regulator [Gammaproteobacteria bacterium]|nr:response regulator [Gammaproteobacteria bacterium]
MAENNALAKKVTIAIADDDDALRLIIKTVLESDGYKILEGRNGRDVVEVCYKNSVDLVLLDKIMPEMDGIEVTRNLSAGLGSKCPPIIMITALNDTKSIDEAFEAGAIEYITKPIQWSVLKNRIRVVLEQQQSRCEIERANAMLRESEQELRAIFNHFIDGVVYTDINGIIQTANPAAEHIFGATKDQLSGKNISDILCDGNRMLEKLVEHGGCDPKCNRKSRGKRLDGTEFAIEIAAKKTELNSKSIVVFSLKDIEQRLALEKQLQHAQKMQALGQLTGGVAHDFNNILGGMMGYATLAERSLTRNDSDKIGQCLMEIHTAGQRATDLIRKMLAYSRGVISEEKESKPVEILGESIKMLRPVIPSSVTMTVNVEEGLPAIQIDPTHFHQIITNICINARDAMHGNGVIEINLNESEIEEGGRCASCLEVVPEGRFVMLTVKDSGPGIQEADLANIFNPFFTTKEVGKGSGLGLSMVHGLVHGKGGHILVESTKEGSIFKILFPSLTKTQAIDSREL